MAQTSFNGENFTGSNGVILCLLEEKFGTVAPTIQDTVSN